jgi:RNA polymerase sigma-70 factor (sigma-E family)
MASMEAANPFLDVAVVPPATTAELVDHRARYAEVYALHHDRLVGLGFLLTGDRHRAEDAVAEAFARAWPHWRRGRVTDERAYLTRAVVNEVNSVGRRTGRDERYRATHRPAAPDATAGTDGTVDRVAIVAALAKLPKRQRAVVVLRFYDDLSEASTAALLGMRLGTVKSQTSRGLARLRQLLSEEDR